MLRFVLATLTLSGCSTTSHTGTFVHDIRVVDTALDVTSCEVSVTVSTTLDGHDNERANRSGCRTERQELPANVEEESP